MRGVGTVVNVATVLAGATTGLLLRRALPGRVRDTVPQALGVFTIALGMRQALESSNVLIMLGGLLSGALVGSLLSLDRRLDTLLSRSERRILETASDEMSRPVGSGHSQQGNPSSLKDAAVLPSLVFCVGPMTVLGAIQDGARGEPELLIVKAVMDGFASMAFAAGLGAGVYIAAAVVLVFQGGLTAMAGLLEPFLSDRVLSETTAVGGLIVIAIGIKLLKVRDFPVVDYLPALITTPLVVAIVLLVQ